MRIWIGTDMEGIGGVVHREHTARNGREHDRARRWMTDEVNAAIEACFDAGATAVTVAEGHGTCRNLIPELLDRRARLCYGQMTNLPYSMLQGLDDSYQGAMLIGYHARAGLAPGLLDHNFWSQTLTEVLINGMAVGEAEMNAAYAGALGIPTLMIAGDDVLAGQIEANMAGSGVVTATTKRALGRFHAECLHPAEAAAEVGRRAAESLGLLKAGSVKPFGFGPKLTMQVTFLHPMYVDLACMVPGTKRIGPYRAEYRCKEYRELFNTFVLWCATSGIGYYANQA